jgi:hypothetical protein
MPLPSPHDIKRIGAPHALGVGRSSGALAGLGLGSGGAGSGVAAGVVAGSNAVGYRPAPLSEAPPSKLQDAASERWVRRIVDIVNSSLRGKLNVTMSVTLTANATSTIIKDARISAFSALVFVPLSANAAAEQAAGGLYVSAQKSGEATITHANSAQDDRAFRIVILA